MYSLIQISNSQHLRIGAKIESFNTSQVIRINAVYTSYIKQNTQ